MQHLNKVSHCCDYCDRWNLCEYVCLLLFKILNFSLTLTELENIHSGRHSSESDLYLFRLQRFFSTQLRCCLFFSWIELQMLLICCLIRLRMIKLRHYLYLLYLFPGLDLGLFMSYLCDLIFNFFFILIMINRMNTDTLVVLLIFQKMSYHF